MKKGLGKSILKPQIFLGVVVLVMSGAIGSARSALADIVSNADTPETLRRSAIHASALIGGK